MSRSSVILATVITAVCASASSKATLNLGQPCNASSNKCAGGAGCYAVNSGLITTCGNFQSSCSSTSQCATNTCVDNFCSGPLLLALGSACNSTSYCQNGASCYAVNSEEILRCGNLEASCTWDGQCAFNTCSDGSCSGQLFSSSSSSSFATATTSATFSSQSTATAPSLSQGTSTAAPYVNGSATSATFSSQSTATAPSLTGQGTSTATPYVTESATSTSIVVITSTVAGQSGNSTGGSTVASQTATLHNGGPKKGNVRGSAVALVIVFAFMFLM